uniref:Uncharacterized protein n=1 Tax=Ralstonia solanacearum TaxID=305 RepID=A0A0S4WCL2_RALSL|nr:protein of unknown function [Ralstonia solanacearum]
MCCTAMALACEAVTGHSTGVPVSPSGVPNPRRRNRIDVRAFGYGSDGRSSHPGKTPSRNRAAESPGSRAAGQSRDGHGLTATAPRSAHQAAIATDRRNVDIVQPGMAGAIVMRKSAITCEACPRACTSTYTSAADAFAPAIDKPARRRGSHAAAAARPRRGCRHERATYPHH